MRPPILSLIVLLALPFSVQPKRDKIKRLQLLNWHVNATRLHSENPSFPESLHKGSESLGFLCRDDIPAAIHLVSEKQFEDCVNHEPPITFCPNPVRIAVIDLEPYPAGVYYITSYSNSTDDGADESRGGFCDEGLSLELEIVEGIHDGWNEQEENMHGAFDAKEHLRIIEEIKATLRLSEINDLNRRYVKKHGLNLTADVVNAVRGRDDSDSGPEVDAVPVIHAHQPPTASALEAATIPPNLRYAVFISVGLFLLVTSVLGVALYLRRVSPPPISVPYINLDNEMTLVDLNPV